MLEQLKEEVFAANKKLVAEGLVILTWGNASAYDEAAGCFVIKPSGVPYDTMKASDMVVVDLDGKVIEGAFKPSTDMPTHLALYRAWGKEVRGVVHTHSKHAVMWAQAGLDVPILGTTHADYFYGDIPCFGALSEKEVDEAYEKNTGLKIVEGFGLRKIQPLECPACLLSGHGPFTWGKTAAKAVENSVVLEAVAEMALHTLALNPKSRLPRHVMDKHYLRKHGKNAYYGQ